MWQSEVRGVAVRREERWTFSWTNTPVVGLAKWRQYFVSYKVRLEFICVQGTALADRSVFVSTH